MDGETTRAARMDHMLRAEFTPETIAIVDDSARHAGHAGAAPGGETHFTVTIVSPRFEGMSRVTRSRAVHASLAGEFATGLHALSLSLKSPGERR